MTQLLVSVVMPAFNAAATVERALRSVADQTYRPLEVLVIDDASGDDTVARVQDFAARIGTARIGADSGLDIRVIRRDRNGGPARARNVGIDAAQGAYLAFLDADDTWMPDKTARQAACLDADPDCVLVGCRTQPVRDDGSTRPATPVQTPHLGTEGWKGLLHESWLHTGCVMTRTALARAEKFDPALTVAEDRDLWIRLARHGRVAFVPEQLARRYRVADGFMNRHRARMHLDLVPLIERHVHAFRADLSGAEARRILGNTYTITGRYLHASGADRALGRRYVWRAIRQGVRVPGNLWHLITNSSPARGVKGRLRGRRHAGLPTA